MLSRTSSYAQSGGKPAGADSGSYPAGPNSGSNSAASTGGYVAGANSGVKPSKTLYMPAQATVNGAGGLTTGLWSFVACAVVLCL